MIEYLKICRVDHWLKNIFILFGHAVAIVLPLNLEIDSSLVVKALLSLIPACLIASANYILNEILDAPFDRLHPTKKERGVAAGKVSVPVLWVLMGVLIVMGIGLGWVLFPGSLYTVGLLLLLASGVVYNVLPLRLKDRAYLDVIAESFNNPIRLWLGWYALVESSSPPPLSIVLAWWFFGALLMTGKRYAEFRFIGNAELSGRYRKSFQVYTNRKLIIAMITYANLFCFCTGVAMATYPALYNLVLVFPMIILAVIVYFNHAMREENARLEPEQLLRNGWVIVLTMVTAICAVGLLYAYKYGYFDVRESLKLMQGRW